MRVAGLMRSDEIRRGRMVGLKQELVASSACNNRARWKVPTWGAVCLCNCLLTKHSMTVHLRPAPCNCT